MITKVIETPLHTRYTLWVERWQAGRFLGISKGYPGVLWPHGDKKWVEVPR